MGVQAKSGVGLFLSTLSLRRATQRLCGRPGGGRDFYPRSPCGERRNKAKKQGGIYQFLSTLSLRRATILLYNGRFCSRNFYPRSPCGERLLRRRGWYRNSNFYPRSPCGERQEEYYRAYIWPKISIHALLAESDILPIPLTGTLRLFLSTLSLRRATFNSFHGCIINVFLSTLSLRRATRYPFLIC